MCRNYAYSCIVRFKDTGGWSPIPNCWFRAWVSSQNKTANGTYPVSGSILLMSGEHNNIWTGAVSGGLHDYSDLNVTWSRYYTGEEINSKIGPLFGQYGTLIVSSQSNDPSSLEGGEVILSGKGGNTGNPIYLDGNNNNFRICSKFGGTAMVIYEFRRDGIYKNGVKIC